MTSRIDPNIEVYNPEFRRSINVKPYKPDIMEDLVQNCWHLHSALILVNYYSNYSRHLAPMEGQQEA